MSQTQVEIIAEIAQAHEGSLGIAHSYIDALATAGVDTVKFQMHIASAESSRFEQFRVNFSYEDKTRYDYWERMEFDLEQWQGLKNHCEDKGLRFLCSPFSIQAVEWMEKLNTDRYKVASGEVNNLLMIDAICKTGKGILLSSGMSSFDELNATVNYISSRKARIEGIFQCTTAYPTPPEKYGLNVLSELKKNFPYAIGLSDHSGEIFAPLSAVALGAEMLEMHVVFDKKMFGPDAASSLTIAEFKQLTDGVRKITTSINHPVDKNEVKQYDEMKNLFGKSLSLRTNKKSGDVIQLQDLETRKPGNMGIKAADFELLLGKKLNRDMTEGDFIQHSDIQVS